MKEVGKTESANTVQTIVSPYFGELEVLPEQIYFFKDGLIGFEDLQHYVLISDEKVDPFKWLQSIEEPALSFPVINPWLVMKDYKPGKRFTGDNLSLFSIVTLKNKENKITANLKAPVVFNETERTGSQEILTSDKYQTNYQITKS